MKQIKILLAFVFMLFSNIIFGQNKPQINIAFSKLYATYDFVQKLSDHYPDNEYKKLYQSSKSNTKKYNSLIKRQDTLNIYEAYKFQGYPTAQKISGMAISFLKRNLITSKTIREFKAKSFGIIPNAELFIMANTIEQFLPVYEALIFAPNKTNFTNKVDELSKFVEKSNITTYFETGLKFYNTEWDFSIPFEISIIPSFSGEFTAEAFLNNAVSEVPLNFNHYDILFSVLMHEIYHILYDGQSLKYKLSINKWFNENPSQNSQYAYLLLNEALATALGNGYVYEQINKEVDKQDWYNVKYINQMAKKMYPLVKEYLNDNKSIDKNFVNKYIEIYDNHFSDWTNELDNILTYRYIISENKDDFNYINQNFPYRSKSESEYSISESSIKKMKETPITKIIIVSAENKNKLKLVKKHFPELRKWKFKANKEFVLSVFLEDKTYLVILNQINSSVEKLLNKEFKDRKINITYNKS